MSTDAQKQALAGVGGVVKTILWGLMLAMALAVICWAAYVMQTAAHNHLHSQMGQ